MQVTHDESSSDTDLLLVTERDIGSSNMQQQISHVDEGGGAIEQPSVVTVEHSLSGAPSAIVEDQLKELMGDEGGETPLNDSSERSTDSRKGSDKVSPSNPLALQDGHMSGKKETGLACLANSSPLQQADTSVVPFRGRILSIDSIDPVLLAGRESSPVNCSFERIFGAGANRLAVELENKAAHNISGGSSESDDNGLQVRLQLSLLESWSLALHRV